MFENVKELYLEGKKVHTLKINNGVIWKASLLPKEYQQVEFIESTGTQWIDTEVIPTITTEIESTIQFTNTASGRFGSYDSNGRFYFGVVSYKWVCGIGGPNNYYHNLGTADTNKHTHKLNSTGYYIDGVVLKQVAVASITITSSITWKAVNYIPSAKIYSFKIREGITLIRDLIPCYRKADNVAGMYDIISGQFFTNKGTSKFIVGKNI